MRDRIRPPKDLEWVLDKLKDEDRIFETKQKGIMFAAAVGFALHRDEVDALDLDQFGEGIRLEYFDKPRDDGFIDALAVAYAYNLNVLDSERQPDRMMLFEKCAELGLQEMKRRCYDERPGDALFGILTLVDEMAGPNRDALPGIDAAVRQLGQFL